MNKERLQQTMQKYKELRDYCEQLYGNIMDNMEEIDRFLEKSNLLRLNQEEIEIMNNPVTGTEMEAVIKKKKKSPKNQKRRTRWLHRSILSNFQRIANAYPSKTLSKIADEGTLPNSFFEAAITLIPKPGKVKDAQLCPTLCDPMDPMDSPWNSPGQNTGVGSCFLLQGIFSTQESNPSLPHYRWILYQLSHQRSPQTRQRQQKKVNYRPVSLMNIDAEILNKILANRIQQHI